MLTTIRLDCKAPKKADGRAGGEVESHSALEKKKRNAATDESKSIPTQKKDSQIKDHKNNFVLQISSYCEIQKTSSFRWVC
jgi:hypothetical protein